MAVDGGAARAEDRVPGLRGGKVRVGGPEGTRDRARVLPDHLPGLPGGAPEDRGDRERVRREGREGRRRAYGVRGLRRADRRESEGLREGEGVQLPGRHRKERGQET